MVSDHFSVFTLFYSFLLIAPKIIILGPPASGRHTMARMLQKKLNAVLVESDELLHDVPSKLKDKLPLNPTIVCDWVTIFHEIF